MNGSSRSRDSTYGRIMRVFSRAVRRCERTDRIALVPWRLGDKPPTTPPALEGVLKETTMNSDDECIRSGSFKNTSARATPSFEPPTFKDFSLSVGMMTSTKLLGTPVLSSIEDDSLAYTVSEDYERVYHDGRDCASQRQQADNDELQPVSGYLPRRFKNHIESSTETPAMASEEHEAHVLEVAPTSETAGNTTDDERLLSAIVESGAAQLRHIIIEAGFPDPGPDVVAISDRYINSEIQEHDDLGVSRESMTQIFKEKLVYLDSAREYLKLHSDMVSASVDPPIMLAYTWTVRQLSVAGMKDLEAQHDIAMVAAKSMVLKMMAHGFVTEEIARYFDALIDAEEDGPSLRQFTSLPCKKIRSIDITPSNKDFVRRRDSVMINQDDVQARLEQEEEADAFFMEELKRDLLFGCFCMSNPPDKISHMNMTVNSAQVQYDIEDLAGNSELGVELQHASTPSPKRTDMSSIVTPASDDTASSISKFVPSSGQRPALDYFSIGDSLGYSPLARPDAPTPSQHHIDSRFVDHSRSLPHELPVYSRSPSPFNVARKPPAALASAVQLVRQRRFAHTAQQAKSQFDVIEKRVEVLGNMLVDLLELGEQIDDTGVVRKAEEGEMPHEHFNSIDSY